MIHVLAEGKDRKGIQLKINYNDATWENTVVVWKGEAVRSRTIPANRFGFEIATSVKSLNAADEMAVEIEKELNL